MDTELYRIESEIEVSAYLANLRYALQHGAQITFQVVRKIDENVNIKYTNAYTMATLFPNENPEVVLRKELQKLRVSDYLRTVKDLRFKNRSEMREFGKVYNGKDEVYIKIRVELLNQSGFGKHTTFVMSFHFAKRPFVTRHFRIGNRR